MKRCPKCEFIYEDDQNLCDMDGALLVFDSRTLQGLPAEPALKASPKRNRAVPAFATLILVLVLGLVSYVSIQRRNVENSYTEVEPSAVSTANPVADVAPTPEAQPSSAEPKPEPLKNASKATSSIVPAKKTTAKPDLKPAKAKADEKKDDSKVGNILKKTGRILKKPFKF